MIRPHIAALTEHPCPEPPTIYALVRSAKIGGDKVTLATFLDRREAAMAAAFLAYENSQNWYTVKPEVE